MQNSQPTQIGKDNKIRRFTVRKSLLWKKAKGVVEPPFASDSEGPKGQNIQSHRGFFEEIMVVIHGSPQPSQQKSEIEIRLSRKDL